MTQYGRYQVYREPPNTEKIGVKKSDVSSCKSPFVYGMPAGCDQKSVLGLQRRFGNMAVTSLLEEQKTPGRSATGPVVQRKKTDARTPEEQNKLVRSWNFLPKKSKIDSSLSQEEKTAIMLADLGKTYDDHLEKGKKYLAGLEDAKIEHSRDKKAYTDKKQPQRSAYDANFADNYVTAIKNDNDGTTARSVSSSGFVGERPDRPRANVYENTIDPWGGTIRARDNYAEKDEARRHDTKNEKTANYKKKGLPNSEVLWQQGMASAKSQLWFSWYKGAQRSRTAMAGIKSMERENIQNPLTRAVVFMAYPNGTSYWSENMTWGKGSEEFQAIMGTPNCAPAIHMMVDHLDEMSHNDIADVTATTTEHLLIRYESS